MSDVRSLFLGDVRPLPTHVYAEGKEWAINPDARNVLRILRMLKDDSVAKIHKTALLRRWFYAEDAPLSPVRPFLAFLHMGREEEICGDEEEDTEADFDYEFDALPIISSFRQLYGIDLMTDRLHFWTFRALLDGCFANDCALTSRVQLRRTDPTEADANMRKAIERVQIPSASREKERQMCEKVAERLRQGLSIDGLL